MAAGHTHVADPLDTVYHEMDKLACTVCSYHVYKSVWSSVANRRTTYPAEEARWPIQAMNLKWQ